MYNVASFLYSNFKPEDKAKLMVLLSTYADFDISFPFIEYDLLVDYIDYNINGLDDFKLTNCVIISNLDIYKRLGDYNIYKILANKTTPSHNILMTYNMLVSEDKALFDKYINNMDTESIKYIKNYKNRV